MFDKTTNHYKVKKEQHDELLLKNITKDYRKSDGKDIAKAVEKDKEIALKLELDDRILKTTKRQSFISIKDHKENFQNNPTCRLLNPTKTELGKISKQKLSNIVRIVRESSGLKNWKNTTEVITWFKNLSNHPSKNRLSFVQFDVKDFYPSITEELLRKSIEWASRFVHISNEDKEIIFKVKHSLLYNKNDPWVKKSNSKFDVAQGAYDSAETCEIVGLYLLSKLKITGLHQGLYRDDGLGVAWLSPRNTENLKKKICGIFTENGLSITIKVNVKCVDFLDVTLDIESFIYKPYMKENDIPLYVNKQSNHPPSILKNIPLGVNKRLSNISANEQVFNNSIQPYQNALYSSGYDYKLKFEPNTGDGNKKNNRKRNITWFNPPYSLNVSSHIGKQFFEILDKSIPPNHPLRKILNRNTVKLSYRCMPNMSQCVSRHNSSVSRF